VGFALKKHLATVSVAKIHRVSEVDGRGRRRVLLDESHRIGESPEGLLDLDNALTRFLHRQQLNVKRKQPIQNVPARANSRFAVLTRASLLGRRMAGGPCGPPAGDITTAPRG
jgi:hypothetical protein